MRRLPLVAVLLVPLAGCGKSFKEFTPADGDFTVLMPGTPERKELPAQGLTVTAYGSEVRNGAYMVGFADIPPGTPTDLDGPVQQMAATRKGRVTSQTDGSDGSTRWQEFEMEIGDPKGYVAGRVMTTPKRFYLFFAIGKDTRLSTPEVRAFIDSFRVNGPAAAAPPGGSTNPWAAPFHTPAAPPAAPADPGIPPPGFPRPGPQMPPLTPPIPRPTTQVLGGSGPEAGSAGPAGSLLVGFEVGYGKFGANDVIGSVRAVYRAGERETIGSQYGPAPERPVRVVARPGYAVGAISGKAGLLLDGFKVIFMKVTGDRLDPNDRYESEWLGGPGGFQEEQLGGDGTPAVGIRVHRDQGNVTGLGLIFRAKSKGR